MPLPDVPAGAAGHPESGAAPNPFADLLARMIARLDAKLLAVQRGQLALAMPSIRWEFPDADWLLHLVADRDALRIADPCADPALFVRMTRATLEDAVFGRRSLGAAFLAGRIHVRGMSPLRLREFIRLIDPLLESYREAHGDLFAPSASASPLVS
jgi:hypothetical protein